MEPPGFRVRWSANQAATASASSGRVSGNTTPTVPRSAPGRGSRRSTWTSDALESGSTTAFAAASTSIGFRQLVDRA